MLRYFLLLSVFSVVIFAGETFSLDEQTKLLKDWKEEFRKAYDADVKNSKLQTFDHYWGYIEQFFLTAKIPYSLRYYYGLIGWFDTIDKLSPKLPKEDREKYRERILKLGKAIAKEWAKENPERKFFSTASQGKPNLEELNKKMSPFMDQATIQNLQKLDEFLLTYEKHFGLDIKAEEPKAPETNNPKVGNPESSESSIDQEVTKEDEPKQNEKVEDAKAEDTVENTEKKVETEESIAAEESIELESKESKEDNSSEDIKKTEVESDEISALDRELMETVVIAENFDVEVIATRVDQTIARVSNIIEEVHQVMAR